MPNVYCSSEAISELLPEARNRVAERGWNAAEAEVPGVNVPSNSGDDCKQDDGDGGVGAGEVDGVGELHADRLDSNSRRAMMLWAESERFRSCSSWLFPV